MPKVEFHTEKSERINFLTNALTEKYGPVLHIPQACEAIGISKWTLYEMAADHQIAYSRSKKDSGRFIFNAIDVAKYIEKNRQEVKE